MESLLALIPLLVVTLCCPAKMAILALGQGCTVGISTLVHAMEGSDVNMGDEVLIGAFSYFIGSGPYGTEQLDVAFKKARNASTRRHRHR